jgi:hypothetical protein
MMSDELEKLLEDVRDFVCHQIGSSYSETDEDDERLLDRIDKIIAAWNRRPAQPATPAPDMAGDVERVVKALRESDERCYAMANYRHSSSGTYFEKAAQAALAALEDRNHD